MKFPPVSVVTLSRLLRRDGFAFFGKCARYAFSRDAWLWLLCGGRCAAVAGRRGTPARPDRLSCGVGILEQSAWFDADWYLRQNPDVEHAGVDPGRHYLEHGRESLRNPGPDFVGTEYLAINQDVRAAGVNPLVHFERHGRDVARRCHRNGALVFRRSAPASPRRRFRGAFRRRHGS